jgi:hypothetical protein
MMPATAAQRMPSQQANFGECSFPRSRVNNGEKKSRERLVRMLL